MTDMHISRDQPSQLLALELEAGILRHHIQSYCMVKRAGHEQIALVPTSSRESCSTCAIVLRASFWHPFGILLTSPGPSHQPRGKVRNMRNMVQAHVVGRLYLWTPSLQYLGNFSASWPAAVKWCVRKDLTYRESAPLACRCS